MPFEPTALLTELDAAQLEALVVCMVLAADADGELADEERDTLKQSIASLAKGTEHETKLSGDALETLVAKTLERLGNGEREACFGEVKTALTELDGRRAALGLAIAVTAADGIVRTSERELIMELAEALDVDRDEAADLVRDITRP